MVQVLPRVSLVVECFVGYVSGLLTLGLFGGQFLQCLEAIGSDESFFVSAEDAWSLELSVQRTIAQDLLHHELFGSLSVGTSDVVDFADFGLRFAVLVLATSCSLGGSFVRSALL